MQIEYMPLHKLTPYVRNPRKNDPAVDAVAESLSRYGFQQPIVVDANHVIVVGHTRYKAARKLGFTEVPVLVAADLTEDQVAAYRLADNRTNQYAKWDDNLLAEEFRNLFENISSINELSEMSAFTELEIDRLLNGKTYGVDPNELAKNADRVANKRIALLTPKNSYVNRGVATYINGWIEWGLRNGVQVDVISDDADLNNNQFERYTRVSQWISPPQPVSIPSKLHDDNYIAMRSPVVRLQDSVNIRTALLHAMTQYHYDAIICNTIETLFTVVSMGLHTEHPNIYYATHSWVDVNMGQSNYQYDLSRSIIANSNIKLLVQSEWMREHVLKGYGVTEDRVSVVVPMLGQPEFLDSLDAEFTDRKGILYIGPYEDRKNPAVYIQALKNSGLPALVITPSQTSADKFKREFLKHNIEHEIHVALTGSAKVAAMQRAALAIIPSKDETFCYTAFEAAHICRTIVPGNRGWTTAHADWCIRVEEDQIPYVVTDHYNKPLMDSARAALKQQFAESDRTGLKLIAPQSVEPKGNNAFTKWMEQKGQTTLREFFNSRPTKVLDEVFYVVRAQHNTEYLFEHTQNDTIVTVEGYTPNADITQEDINNNLAREFGLEINNG